MIRRMSALAGLCLTVVLAACGSGTSSKSASTTSPSTAARTSTSTAPTTTPSAPSTQARHTADEAAALIKRLYDPYAAATIDTPVVGNCFLPQTGRPCPLALSEVMTSGLIATLLQRAHEGTGVDPVACAQNMPARVSYDAPAQTDGTAVIVVHTFYGEPGALRDDPIRVTVDLTSLKLSGLTCPPA